MKAKKIVVGSQRDGERGEEREGEGREKTRREKKGWKEKIERAQA